MKDKPTRLSDLEKAVLRERKKGTPDVEIGKKYDVSLRQIERIITKNKGINISVDKGAKKIRTLMPKDFKDEVTTVWSFRSRGNWATHSGEYRGNWSPYIPRNVITRYSKQRETVLDYFCGAGTTAVEAKLLGRKCIAFDINDKAVELARKNLLFDYESPKVQIYEPELLVGDARDLGKFGDNSIDLICAHPPYSNIVQYSHDKEHDLSFLDIEEFLSEMKKVAEESFRVLRPGRQCAILIGDTRRKKHVVPLAFKLIDVYLKAGFRLRELVIKRQHNCKTTGFWYNNSIKYNFLLLAHEYLPIFEKPKVPISARVKEGKSTYDVIRADQAKLTTRVKLKGLETTTVWIFPEKDFEKRLRKNVIERYAHGGKKKLLYVQPPLLEKLKSETDVNTYVRQVRQHVQHQLTENKSLKYVVVQTRDVRINGYIEPLAKRILNTLDFDQLKIKEIIVITSENQKDISESKDGYLNITHRYLLVYSVVR